jgi:hypothetical protein
MSANTKLVAIAASLAMLAASVCGAYAERRAKSEYRHVADGPGQVVRDGSGRTVRLGSTAGWRHRTGRGWDNSCHNLPYLINMYACSNK